jgi:hypothetical protein
MCGTEGSIIRKAGLPLFSDVPRLIPLLFPRLFFLITSFSAMRNIVSDGICSCLTPEITDMGLSGAVDFALRTN